MTFPIYNLDGLLFAMGSTYLARKPNTVRQSIKRLVIGKPLACHINKCTWFIVRRNHMVPVTRTRYVIMRPWRAGGYEKATHYRTSRVDYMIARYLWESEQVQEVQAVATKHEATELLWQYRDRIADAPPPPPDGANQI